jgi:hypothetical protein
MTTPLRFGFLFVIGFALLMGGFEDFVADTLTPDFSAISLVANFTSFIDGSAISLEIKGVVVGLSTLAGKNLYRYRQ